MFLKVIFHTYFKFDPGISTKIYFRSESDLLKAKKSKCITDVPKEKRVLESHFFVYFEYDLQIYIDIFFNPEKNPCNFLKLFSNSQKIILKIPETAVVAILMTFYEKIISDETVGKFRFSMKERYRNPRICIRRFFVFPLFYYLC